MIEKITYYIKNSKTKEIVNKLYFLGLVIYSIEICLGSCLINTYSFPETIRPIMYYSTFLLVIPKAFFQKYNKQQAIVSITIIVMCLYCAFMTSREMLLIIPFILIGIKNTDLKKLSKIVFFISLFYILTYAGLALIECIKANDFSNLIHFSRDRDKIFDLVQHNHMGGRGVFCYVNYLYFTNRDNKRFLKFFILVGISILLYGLVQSVASIITMVIVSSYLLFENIPLYKKYAKFLTIVCIIFVVVFCVSSMYMDTNIKIVSTLDKLLTGRIRLSVSQRETFGLSFFSTTCVNPEYIYNDSLFTDYLLRYGYSFCIPLVCVISYLLFNENKSTFIYYMSCALMLFTISQRSIKEITLSLIPILVFKTFMEDDKVTEIHKNI